MQPYPWWTLYLEPPFRVRFGISTWLYIYTWFKRNMMKYDELNIYKYIWSSLWYPLQQGGGSKYLVLRGSKCELRTPSFWFRVLSSHLEPRAIFEIFSKFFRNEVLSSCPRLYNDCFHLLLSWKSMNMARMQCYSWDISLLCDLLTMKRCCRSARML